MQPNSSYQHPKHQRQQQQLQRDKQNTREEEEQPFEQLLVLPKQTQLPERRQATQEFQEKEEEAAAAAAEAEERLQQMQHQQLLQSSVRHQSHHHHQQQQQSQALSNQSIVNPPQRKRSFSGPPIAPLAFISPTAAVETASGASLKGKEQESGGTNESNGTSFNSNRAMTGNGFGVVNRQPPNLSSVCSSNSNESSPISLASGSSRPITYRPTRTRAPYLGCSHPVGRPVIDSRRASDQLSDSLARLRPYSATNRSSPTATSGHINTSPSSSAASADSNQLNMPNWAQQLQSNRPRSNSEGKSKKPNLIMSTLRKSMYLPWPSTSSASAASASSSTTSAAHSASASTQSHHPHVYHHHQHQHQSQHSHQQQQSPHSSHSADAHSPHSPHNHHLQQPQQPSQSHSSPGHTDLLSCPVSPCHHDASSASCTCPDQPRSRSGSGGSDRLSANPMARVMDIFRNRSLSVGYNEIRRKLDSDGNDYAHPGSLFRRHSVDPEARKNRAFGPRSLDSIDFHQNHFSLYRDARTSRNGSYNPMTSTDSICDRLDFEDLEKDEELIYVKFFKFYHCYDLVPISAKLVVFDTQLLVKKAFYALVNHGVRAAPLWDSSKQKFVGMLTITYFINVLINYYNISKVKMDELEEQRLETWRNMVNDQRDLITIDPESSVFEAIETLVKYKIHRLPIIDPITNNVIYIITHKRILKFFFLYCYYLPMPYYMNYTVRELNIGTYNDIALTTMDTKLIDVMLKLVDRRVSALPVVDENGTLVDIYSKFDIFNLAAEKMYSNLDMTIRKALEFREHWCEKVIKCTLDETFISVLEKIVKAEVHRIVVVDEKDSVIGIISLSDILHYLALRNTRLSGRKTVVTNETLNEEPTEEASSDSSYMNNNCLFKNKNLFEEESVFQSELQKIDEV